MCIRDSCGPWDPVIVGPLGSAIGPKSKPVYAGGSKTPSTTGVKNFDEWFNDVSGVNSSKQVVFQLVSTGKGSFVYETDFFFPIDGQLFDAESGNPDSNRFPSDDGKKRNFHFTYELHTTFRYKAGSTFLFRGDDDVFVYINGKLAVNIGGIHVPMEGKIDLDAPASHYVPLPSFGQFTIRHCLTHTSGLVALMPFYKECDAVDEMLQKYAGDAARSRGSSPKLQVLNTALMTAQSGLSPDDAQADREFRGRLGESAVGAHLANAAASGTCELFYWREGNREVDFVVRSGRTVLAIEVKSGRAPDAFPGLNAFAQAFRPKRSLIVGGDGIPPDELPLRPVGHWLHVCSGPRRRPCGYG